MFDMSWGEIMVIGGVALIVIGPKDLPKALRTVGQMTTKVRRMAGEFQSQFSEAMREAELEDVRKEVEGLNRQVSTATSTAFNPLQTIRDEIKSSVEGKATTGETLPVSGEWTAGQSELTATAVAESGPAHLIEPMVEAHPVSGIAAAPPDTNHTQPFEPLPAAASEWTAGQSELTATSLEESGPAHQMEPMAEPAPHPVSATASLTQATIPEVQPLVPLPIDEPVLPAPDPSRLATSPGLEPAVEADMPKSVQA